MYKQLLSLAVAACIAPCFATEGWIHDDMAAAGGKLKTAREAAQTFRAATTDPQRVEALSKLLELAPRKFQHSPFYDSVREQIAAYDHEDTTGLALAREIIALGPDTTAGHKAEEIRFNIQYQIDHARKPQ